MSSDRCVCCWEKNLSKEDKIFNCTHSKLHWMCKFCVPQYTSPFCATCRQPLKVTEETSLCEERGYCDQDGDTGYCRDCCQPMPD